LAGEFYFPTGADNTRHAALNRFPIMSGAPKLFFRTIAPAHGGFSQQINTGRLTESDFDYKTLLPH
jgi:hypothetical protein